MNRTTRSLFRTSAVIEEIERVEPFADKGETTGLSPSEEKWLPRFILLGMAALMCLLSLALDYTWDNDVYFLIETGRDILANGFSYVEPLTLHEGFDYAAQQWLVCVLDALLYEAGGRPAVSLASLAIWCAAIAVHYRALFVGTKGNRQTSALLAGIVALSCFVFAKSNPRGWDMLFFSLSWIFVSEWKVSRNPRWLAAQVLASILLANLHVSMWPLMVICPAAGMLSSAIERKDRLALLLTAVLSAVASLLTPYGIQGTWYVFASLLSESYSLFAIQELKPLTVKSQYFPLFVLATFAYFFMRKRDLAGGLDRDALFAFGLLAGLSAGRSAPIFLFSAALAMSESRDCACGRFLSEIRKPLRTAACTMPLIVALFVVPIALPNVGFSSEETQEDRCSREEALLELEQAGLPQGGSVWTSFNDGGYAEFKGFKAYIDPRAELFVPEINGKKDVAKEYTDFMYGYAHFEPTADEYRFDAVLFPKDFALRDTYDEIAGSGYRLVFENDDYWAFLRAEAES